MKKIIGVVVCISIVVALLWAWLTFPWAWVIKRRVIRVGSAKITQEFDAWWRKEGKDLTNISVASLPLSLRALHPVGVHRDKDGIYLVTKRRFVVEDGIYIASPGTTRASGSGTDPSWHPLSGRIYRYHISG